MTPVWAHPSQNPEFHAEMISFISTRIWGQAKKLNADTIMGVADGKTIVAGVGFHNYDSEAGVIEVSAASDSKRWLTRPILLALFSFPFVDLKCQAVVARIDEANAPLTRIFEAYGFEKYVIPRLRGRNKAETVMVLTEEAWRKNGFHKELGHG